MVGRFNALATFKNFPLENFSKPAYCFPATVKWKFLKEARPIVRYEDCRTVFSFTVSEEEGLALWQFTPRVCTTFEDDSGRLRKCISKTMTPKHGKEVLLEFEFVAA